MLRCTFSCVLSLVFALANAPTTFGQAVLIQQDKPFRSNALAGIVVAPNEEPLVGVSVEWLGRDWKGQRATRKTNSNGYFSFKVSAPGVYFLKLSLSGFQQHLIKIRVSKANKFQPKVVMEIAT